LLQERPGNNFGIAFFFSLFIALITGIVVLVLGKNESFQLINRNHNEYADFFFQYFTYYGDGWVWVPFVLFCFFFRKKYIIAVIAGIIISTLLAQFMKRVIYPEELRPFNFLSENFPVHLVDGVEIKKLHSFPSGHTTTAFTASLILAHLLNNKAWSLILPVLAFMAGYSRVYLGQHFLTDVVAGMCIGILSAILSLLIYRAFINHIIKKANLKNKNAEV
jgi:membrane-associated phospholipid phosphatase